MKWIISLVTIVGISIISVSNAKVKQPAADLPQTQLTDSTEWQLVAIHGKKDWARLPEKVPGIRFGDQQRVSGFAGCNRFAGSYTISGTHIKFGPLVSTKMFCVQSQSTEQLLLEALEKADRIQVSEKELVLYGAGEKLLKFGKPE